MNDDEISRVIKTEDEDGIEALFARARAAREASYGKSVYLRGLIEFTNFCENDCYYCGIRRSNTALNRYRLSLDEILNCCRAGSELGLKTFVLQGGEDPYFTADRVAEIVSAIRREFSGSAITLSIGERAPADYALFFRSGANRYLLRHETASDEHYKKLHPPSMRLSERKACLYNLKKIGFQTGAGFMVGSPFQKPEHLLEDIRFLRELKPEMVGVGPFIPHNNTPFREKTAGSILLCLKMIAIVRVILPDALIPATTAMETIAPNGRELAMSAGANVIMPNISPVSARKLYSIYNNKSYGAEDIEKNISVLKEKIIASGLTPDFSRGDAR